MTESQRQLFESVLSQMKSGILMATSPINLTFINSAALELLNISKYFSAEQLELPPEVSQVIERTIESGLEQEVEIALTVIGSTAATYLHVSSQVMETNEGRAAVLILRDMTRLHRLENMRKEFVANVSHELKTPITSIKAAVETLQDGARYDATSSDRFLDIIARQSDRLNVIIEDLLSLSRLENEREVVSFEKSNVTEVLQEAIRSCEFKAGEKKVKVQLRAASDLIMNVNATLMEQAIVNLIDNAIKYSDAGTEVVVDARIQNKEFLIEVRDQGRGIDPEHHARIFERFYRVDKARSRREGGSGLGLSIVKHIAQLHGGIATVHSQPGEGSTFAIHLPHA